MLAKQRSWLVVVLQVILIVSAATASWLVRFDFGFPHKAVFLSALPLLVFLRLVAMARFNLFHGYWRYTGMSDALDVVKGVATGSIAFLIVERFIVGEKAFPVSIYFMEALLTAVSLGGVRMFSRAVLQTVQSRSSKGSNKTVVVVGAGCAGAMLLRELPRSGYTAVALVDDDPAKARVKLHGVSVAGLIDQLPQVVACYEPDEIMIAIPSATGEQMSRITERCQETGVQFRTIPGLADLIHGTVTVDQLREVNLEDLLGRDPVFFDLDSVKRRLAGRVVMVTGAAGSIGSELCHQILSYAPAKLVCVDQAETPLFYLQNAESGSSVKRVFCVADITDCVRMRDVIQEHGVTVIFHAAAYKHVPLMEDNLEEAVKNNVLGLWSLIELADQCGCEDFLLISSDKAVNPSSFMGCTKRIGELIISARTSAHMRCLSVRFGNVLGSQGSVIPLFQEQIRIKRQITVTHPEITRYFMTIPEAVSLVLQAFAIGEKNDILVLDMGKPVRILDMAKTLIRLSGIPLNDVEIVFCGLRPGEKLYEELFYDFEQPFRTRSQKILRTRGHLSVWPDLLTELEVLRAECRTGVAERIRSKVQEIVPQYQWTPTDEVHHKLEVPSIKHPIYQVNTSTNL